MNGFYDKLQFFIGKVAKLGCEVLLVTFVHCVQAADVAHYYKQLEVASQ